MPDLTSASAPVALLSELVRHASVSADPAFASGMAGARDHLAGLLASLGFAVESIATPRHPILLASRGAAPRRPHVLIYGHYDVQPPDPLDLWTSPPFEPTVRDNRIYGRGAADNKGPVIAAIVAVARLLEASPDLPLQITFVLEGEEEIGSPSFAGFLRSHRRRLAADYAIVIDTASPSPKQVVITNGLRGILTLDVHLRGPASDLHSGIHGGVLLNPIQALAELLASLHKPDGSVNLPGFYDPVRKVHAWERAELARLRPSAAAYRRLLGIRTFHTRRGISPFEATRFLPTLEINGIGGGYQGAGPKTVIPSHAFAKLSCRLVPDQEPLAIARLLERTLRKRARPEVSIEVHHHHHGPPYVVIPPGRPNTPADQRPALARAFTACEDAVERHFGRRPLYLREGGSVPIVAALRDVLGADSVLLGLYLPEDRLHAPDESFDLGMMLKGISVISETLASSAG